MELRKCSFCGKDENEAIIIARGIEAMICDACLGDLVELYEASTHEIRDKQKWSMDAESVPRQVPTHTTQMPPSKIIPKQIQTPQKIYDYLEEYVIGQTYAKKVLSVAVYNHYKRLYQQNLLSQYQYDTDTLHRIEGVELEKSNVILVGSTGTGKTLLAKTIAHLLDVPFAIADATVFTESGYVGEDVESILSRLLQASNYDVAAAEKGIVYIDEIDKIARKQGANPSITKDVGGEGVQQAMLKLLEGSIVLVPPQGGRKHPEQKMVSINTEKILFICGGAFDGIDKIVARRVNTHSIGFNHDKERQELMMESMKQFVNTQDLKAFGLIPELLGRLPVVASLEDLNAPSLKNILTKPKNALLKQYEKLFLLEGIRLRVEEDVLDYIVEKALEYQIGARGLRSICEHIFLDAMFETNHQSTKKTLHITLAYAQRKFEDGKMHFYDTTHQAKKHTRKSTA